MYKCENNWEKQFQLVALLCIHPPVYREYTSPAGLQYAQRPSYSSAVCKLVLRSWYNYFCFRPVQVSLLSLFQLHPTFLSLLQPAATKILMRFKTLYIYLRYIILTLSDILINKRGLHVFYNDKCYVHFSKLTATH